MHGNGGYLGIILVFLVAAVIAVPLFRRLGLGAILGYLVAGVAIGPDGLKLVPDPEDVLAASEFGVDPDLGAGLHVPIGDGVHHGHQGEMGVDGDVTDPAVHGEYLIGRKPPFRGAFEHTITAS